MDTIEKISVNGVLYNLAGTGGGSSIINITHSELKSLISSSGLNSGARYRITDYVTEFKSWESAGHQFDIVVTALTSNTISSEAFALHHEGDSYFSSSDLTAWKLMYDINGDTTKYNQAKEGGKGFIYKMTDENNNTAPYDFKNALRRLTNEDNVDIPEGEGELYYTFSLKKSNTITDYSLSYNTNCKDNTIYSAVFNFPILCAKPFALNVNISSNNLYNEETYIFCQLGGLSYNNIKGNVYTKGKINNITGNEFTGNIVIDGIFYIESCTFISNSSNKVKIVSPSSVALQTVYIPKFEKITFNNNVNNSYFFGEFTEEGNVVIENELSFSIILNETGSGVYYKKVFDLKNI